MSRFSGMRSRAFGLLTAVVIGLGGVVLGPSTAASAGTASISGTVNLGTSGSSPAAGEVRVYYKTYSQTLDITRSVLTDAAGSYSFGSLDQGSYYLFFDYLGSGAYADKWYRQSSAETQATEPLSLPNNNSNVTALTQVLGLPGTIAGTVSLAGTTDLPAAGEVLVSYKTMLGGGLYTAESSPVPVAAGGGYSLPNLLDGGYVLHFTYAGTGPYQSFWGEYGYTIPAYPVTLSLNAGQTRTYDAVQPRLATISGHVDIVSRFDVYTAPSGSVRVDLEQRIAGVWSSVAGGTAVTGVGGAFSFTGLLSVSHRATVTYLSSDGHAAPSAQHAWLAGEMPTGDWSIELGSAANITGKIYLGDYSTPAGAGDVSIEYRQGTTLVKSALTTAGGNYLIHGLPELSGTDKYTVTYHYLGSGSYGDATESLNWTRDWSWEVLLDSAAVITGHVSLGAAGVSAGAGEVRVKLGSTLRETVTDADGNYRLGGLNEGDYLLELEYLGTGDYAGGFWPDAAQGELYRTIHVGLTPLMKNIQLPDAGLISGHVMMNGAPLADVYVIATYFVPPEPGDPPGALDRPGAVGAVTAADGSYSFPHLREETYRLEFFAWSLGRTQTWGGTAINPDGVLFDLAAGEVRTGMDADLTGGGLISGNGTCASCGAPRWLQANSQITIEVLDTGSGEWVQVARDGMARPTAAFSYYAEYAGTYRLHANYRIADDGEPEWGSGYSDPVVVTGSNVTTTVPMVPSVSSRIGGQDRFDVSAAISELGFDPGVPVVYIANGMNFPDALSASPAASLQGGPLLLVTPNEIPASIEAEIARLNPAKIVVVGGPASVSPAVFDQLDAMTADIVRLSGLDRYEVARAVAEYAFGLPDGPGAEVAYIATGRNFPDALSAGGAAALQSAPVITVDGQATALDSETRQLLIDLGVETVKIAGGPGSVSPALMASIDAIPGIGVVRLWGQTRYEASGAINRDAFSNPEVVFLSVGSNYPDALSGGALAGLWEAPLYVIPGDCIPHFVLEDIHDRGPERVIILGGAGSVQPRVLDFAECPWYDFWEI